MKTSNNRRLNTFFSFNFLSLFWWVLPITGSLFLPGWVNAPTFCDLAISLETQAVSCSGASDGTVFITPTKGTPPYQWQWTSGNHGGKGSGTKITNLQTGSYVVSVEDNAGCIATSTVNVSLGTNHLTINTIPTPPSCTNTLDASIKLSPQNGKSPYSWTLRNNIRELSGSGIQITGIGRGSHNITITDASGCAATTQVIINPPQKHSDLDALLELYDSTDGPNWFSNEGWAAGKSGTNCDPCSWFGVFCDQNGRVSQLYLGGMNMTGGIPDLDLPELTILEMNINNLQEPIPDFSHLNKLEKIDLRENQLSGPLPDFSHLPRLVELELSSNNISGEIPDFTGLVNLNHLYLSSNKLTGQIPNFSRLTNLEAVDLGNNDLKGTIPNFTQLPQLTYMGLGNNELQGNIPNFEYLPNLSTLSLGRNRLQGELPVFNFVKICK